MNWARRSAVALVFAACMVGVPTQAWVFHDLPAYIQRISQTAQVLQQWNQIIRSSSQQLAVFKAAHAGMKDWKNLGWTDTLRVMHSPWFDGIPGIEDIRAASEITSLTAEQAMDLFSNAKELQALVSDRRYKADPWYRWRVNALLRQSKEARKVRTAVFQQMKAANIDLMENVRLVKRLRDQVQVASMESPVDISKIQALNAQISAIQAKYQGESLILKNQQAIMFMVGDRNMLQAYENQVDRRYVQDGFDIARKVVSGLRR